ncbi:LysR family transcriptional regulator [Actinoplanes italicus]|uniref:DNA-binding transcriptional LysR family regulator n=1 Tax=Actinoplanes italicus TaxID=113567 RepID=A0A2T0K108_9ACTN|nr:LysR family transcriptional regulator [Actinoplanes italicus]PRX16481.1 DNA-binding transcriptional LysR family regulator [Actinoplanes italicus]GIE33687.1 LysR family transcriptional regulator [Actinoplanes italicus]
MLDVRRLRLLCDLSRLGTIAAVAAAHTYTPSAVSQQLSALEREAGVPLLERTGRRVVLTAAGRLLVQHGETVLAALERTDAALAAARTGLSGELRIGAFPSAIRTLLAPALVTLGERHAALDLLLTELDPTDVPAALLDRRLDVGLVQDYDVVPTDTDPGLDSVPLLDEAVHLAVPLQATGLRNLRDLSEAGWILASPGTLCHTAAVRLCGSAGFTPRARHRVDDFGTVLALVAAGQGVALVPQLAADQLPAGVRLLPLPTRRRTRVAFRQGAAAHPAVAAFVAALPPA